MQILSMINEYWYNYTFSNYHNYILLNNVAIWQNKK